MTNKLRRYLLIVCTLTGCHYDVGEELEITVTCAGENISFTKEIIPILEANCINCHNPDQAQGNVNLIGYQNIAVYVDDGSLLGSIRHDSGFSPMTENVPSLSDCEIQQVSTWIDEGAQEN